jgi:hypothetical protein
MKTNFLYFREQGYQVFVATDAQTNFTINGNDRWDPTVTNSDTHVKVSVTFLGVQSTKIGTAYSGGAVVAGETIIANAACKSISTNDIILANQGADGTNGITISAGDIVTIELVPNVLGTECCLRADRLLSVHSNSDTETEVTFKTANGQATVDKVLLTHPDGNGTEFKLICDYINDVCNGRLGGDFVTVWDKQNGVIGSGLQDAGVTNMTVTLN